MLHGEYTFKNISKFIIPSIMLMIFMAFYTSIDSLFIARFVGTNALAAQNLVMPIYGIAFGVGVMFATGGGAILAVKLGQGKVREVNRDFFSLFIVGLVLGAIALVICLVFQKRLIILMGVTPVVYQYACDYGVYLVISLPFLIVKVLFESVLRIDGRPSISLLVGVIGGVANIILDYAFIVIFKMGIAGAGLGTLLGIVISALVGYFYLSVETSRFQIKPCKPDFRIIMNAVVNGSSEMVTEIALSVTIIILNLLTLKYIGENGVAAVTVLSTIYFMASSLFIGFAEGVAPLISYSYGSNDTDRIMKVISYSKKFVLIASVIIFGVVWVFANPLVSVFVSRSNPVFAVAANGMKYISIVILISGINIYASAFFTAFENGKISAVISFSRTFVFFIMGALIFPLLWGVEGIWMILPFSELCTLLLVAYYGIKYQKKYNYKLI